MVASQATYLHYSPRSFDYAFHSNPSVIDRPLVLQTYSWVVTLCDWPKSIKNRVLIFSSERETGSTTKLGSTATWPNEKALTGPHDLIWVTIALLVLDARYRWYHGEQKRSFLRKISSFSLYPNLKRARLCIFTVSSSCYASVRANTTLWLGYNRNEFLWWVRLGWKRGQGRRLWSHQSQTCSVALAAVHETFTVYSCSFGWCDWCCYPDYTTACGQFEVQEESCSVAGACVVTVAYNYLVSCVCYIIGGGCNSSYRVVGHTLVWRAGGATEVANRGRWLANIQNALGMLILVSWSWQ